MIGELVLNIVIQVLSACLLRFVSGRRARKDALDAEKYGWEYVNERRNYITSIWQMLLFTIVLEIPLSFISYKLTEFAYKFTNGILSPFSLVPIIGVISCIIFILAWISKRKSKKKYSRKHIAIMFFSIALVISQMFGSYAYSSYIQNKGQEDSRQKLIEKKIEGKWMVDRYVESGGRCQAKAISTLTKINLHEFNEGNKITEVFKKNGYWIRMDEDSIVEVGKWFYEGNSTIKIKVSSPDSTDVYYKYDETFSIDSINDNEIQCIRDGKYGRFTYTRIK